MPRRKAEKPESISSKRAKVPVITLNSDGDDEASNSIGGCENPMDEIFKAVLADAAEKQKAADERLKSITPKRLKKSQNNIPSSACEFIEVHNKKIDGFQQGSKDARAVIAECQQELHNYRQLIAVCKKNICSLEAKKIDSGSDRASSGQSPVDFSSIDNSKIVESDKQQGHTNNGDQLTNGKMMGNFHTAFKQQREHLVNMLRQFETHLLGKIEKMLKK